ncbi:glycogen synthase GlgA [Lacticaseibacillus mingshuiensis]|uniref:glycogen synthase GlgA n=1 Tax=Lacticaseibacillus mingshuiensis TaxID=2799574 RepID=UPI00194F7950|nr:glycogen synthase GlgA [Lacticaseibacillus mingshuiensis]
MLKVLFAAAESAPFYKTGGLGDVAYALPQALAKAGVDVRVVLPYYGQLMPPLFQKEIQELAHFTLRFGQRDVFVGIKCLKLGAVPVYLIDNEEFFGRDHIYGDWDDGGRFGFFSLAVIEMLQVLDFIPDILHVNDWHTAMIPVLLKDKYSWVQPLAKIKTQLTIHNLQFQGWFGASVLEDVFGIGRQFFNDDGFAQDGQVNYLKGGINFADRVSTVSPSYAAEILTPAFGEHLDGTLRRQRGKLIGILNGIDTALYDPLTDPALAAPFDRFNLSGKAADKLALQQRVDLPASEAPLFGVVSRLTDQKGMGLLVQALGTLLAGSHAQVVLLGTGEPGLESAFQALAHQFPAQMATVIGFDVTLAQEIYGGADYFVMPSAFEPSGLAQMMAMRYGTVPIVHETGGLRDSVRPFDPRDGSGTGFSFADFTPATLGKMLLWAAAIYRDEPLVYEGLQHHGMAEDFDWAIAAQEYLAGYRELTGQE